MTPQRMGPKPLPLLMAIQALSALSSLSALPLLRDGSLSLKAVLPGSTSVLDQVIRQTTPEAFAQAVQAEAIRRLADFAAGINRYRASPPPDRPPSPPAIWRRGSARLLDYGATHEAAAGGMPVLIVPSLINRGYILDLNAKRSLLRHLAAEGFRPLLVDWGAPDEKEKQFSLTDYIDGHLRDALNFIVEETGQAPALVGYCMGGNLALALAQRNPEKVCALALLATPWDFHAGHPGTLPSLAAMAPGLETMISALGVLPVDVLQALFIGLKPALAGAKFRQFAALSEDSPAADQFVALEDWLNDGVPLAGPVARECLFEWYLDGAPMHGQWRVGGEIIDPANIDLPALVVVPGDDHIVPPASATPLADLLPDAALMTLPTGHIGMITGRHADTKLYRPLADWLNRPTG